MEINPDDYSVVIISSVKNAETHLLTQLGRRNRESWCYAAYNNSGGILSKPTDNGNDFSSYNFFLINPACLRRKNDDHGNCKKIASLLSSIKERNQKIICWLHNTDTINNHEIESLGTLSVHQYFSHADDASLAEKNGPEHFIFTVTANNFREKLKVLVEYSLNKSNPQIILSLFLPLDIDMQALAIIPDEKKKEYLEEMLKEVRKLIKEEKQANGFNAAKLRKIKEEVRVPDEKQKGFSISYFVGTLDELLNENTCNETKMQTIIKQASEFNKWYRGLTEANYYSWKDKILGIVSHDLKNAINSYFSKQRILDILDRLQECVPRQRNDIITSIDHLKRTVQIFPDKPGFPGFIDNQDAAYKGLIAQYGKLLTVIKGEENG